MGSSESGWLNMSSLEEVKGRGEGSGGPGSASDTLISRGGLSGI